MCSPATWSPRSRNDITTTTSFPGTQESHRRAACLCDDEPAQPRSWRWEPPEGPSARQVPGPTAGRAEPTRQVAVWASVPGSQAPAGSRAGSAVARSGVSHEWAAAAGTPWAPEGTGPAHCTTTGSDRREALGGCKQGSGSEALLCLWPQLSPNVRNRRGPQFQLFRDTTHDKRARLQ